MTERTRWLVAIVPIVVLSLTFGGFWYFGSYAPHARRVHEVNEALDRIKLPSGWWQVSAVEVSGGHDPMWQRRYDAPSTPPADALPAFIQRLKEAGGRQALPEPGCQALDFCVSAFLPPHFMLRVYASNTVVPEGNCMSNCTEIRVEATEAPVNS